MMTHFLTDGSSWGVSHNEQGIILKAENGGKYARILVGVETAREMIEELQEHIRQFENGEWFGSHMLVEPQKLPPQELADWENQGFADSEGVF